MLDRICFPRSLYLGKQLDPKKNNNKNQYFLTTKYKWKKIILHACVVNALNTVCRIFMWTFRYVSTHEWVQDRKNSQWKCQIWNLLFKNKHPKIFHSCSSFDILALWRCVVPFRVVVCLFIRSEGINCTYLYVC